MHVHVGPCPLDLSWTGSCICCDFWRQSTHLRQMLRDPTKSSYNSIDNCFSCCLHGARMYNIHVQDNVTDGHIPGAVGRLEASSLGMQAAPSSIPTSGTFFRGDLVMKTFLRPFSLFRWFKKSSCQLLAKECALSTGKLPRRLAQEQCG